MYSTFLKSIITLKSWDLSHVNLELDKTFQNFEKTLKNKSYDPEHEEEMLYCSISRPHSNLSKFVILVMFISSYKKFRFFIVFSLRLKLVLRQLLCGFDLLFRGFAQTCEVYTGSSAHCHWRKRTYQILRNSEIHIQILRFYFSLKLLCW